jgi:murein DD-endopeptidase MepM/ murein hydrolase activator NlpD
MAADYTVEPGDTLSHIAEQYDTTWPELYQLNRDVIDNPDLIYPGQVFVVDGEAKPAPVQAIGRPATGHVTSSYGMRTHPITKVYKLHTGTDYSYGDGNAYAVRAGTVSSVIWSGAYGNMVTVDHSGDAQTRYAHLAGAVVGVGETVSAGQKVGNIGSTGYSTGPHLHFEVLVNGEFVDPAGWLD